MKPIRHSVTDEHVEQFKQRMSVWQQRLNLLDWRVEPSNTRATRGAMAEVAIDPDAKLAVFRIGKNWGETAPTPETIDATALHETLHIMLRPLIDAAVSRDEALIGQIEHSIITVLEKVIPK